MRSAFALRIISGISFLLEIQKSLRAFLCCFFTRGVVTVNGICGDAKGTAAPNGMQQSLKKP